MIDPGFADAHYGMAAANEGLANDKKVIEHARRFLELSPDSPKKGDAQDMISVAKKYISEQSKK